MGGREGKEIFNVGLGRWGKKYSAQMKEKGVVSKTTGKNIR